MDEPSRYRTLGETIRARRVDLGWTQEEPAVRITGKGDVCHQSDVSRLEHGRVGLPRRARLERIAAALDLAVGELLARSCWAGAAFQATDVAAPPGENRRVIAPLSAVDAPLAVSILRSDIGSRLHEAVADAHKLQARSAELLRTSATTLNRAGRLRVHRGDRAIDLAAGGDGGGGDP